MKWNSLLRRGLCLLLSVQLLGSTVMAGNVAEEPTDPLTADEEVTALAGPTVPFYFYALGYGVNLRDAVRAPFALADYRAYFAVETAVDVYGARQYTTQSNVPHVMGDGGRPRTFCVFPTRETLGRVPDQMFEGWYLCPADTMDMMDVPAWSYGDGMEQVAALEYMDGDPGYSSFSKHGDSWNGMDQDYTSAGYVKGGATVALVARWVPSNVAQVTDAGIRLTTVDQTGAAGTVDGFTFDPNTQEYTLRVDADITGLTLALDTKEPYYDYHVNSRGTPVAITAAFGGEPVSVPALTSEMLPKPTENASGITMPLNTLDDPAHASWQTEEGEVIPLAPAQGEDGQDTVIEVVITAPDGVTQTTYTFRVQRLNEPTLTQSYGNTPAGMIQRDTSEVWGTTQQEVRDNKDTAILYFKTNNSFHPTLFPQGEEHQRGSIFKGNYSPKAWLGKNYDQDERAIVVYQDAAFRDPGFSMTDALGYPVTLGEGVYADRVTRTLKLRTATPLSPTAVKDSGGSACYYQAASLTDAPASEVILEADGSDQIDLRGLNVLPGIYTLEYSYTDPESGLTYNAEGDGFLVDKDLAAAFSRTVIVLPAPGDVDMDGAVTTADAVSLRNGVVLGDSSPNTATLNGVSVHTDRTASLFARRVCDLTGDGEITQDDLSKLDKGYLPRLDKAGSSDYFYLPLPTGETGSRYTQKTLAQVSAEVPPDSTAQLKLEYMGKETGALQPVSGATLDPSGPWRADADASIIMGDTFWLGVKLTDTAKSQVLGKTVSTFTFSLTYDSRYVAPAAVVSPTQVSEGGLTDFALRWPVSLRYYNLGAQSQTVWGSGNRYNFTPLTGSARDYSTHYSKVITPLMENADKESDLKELIFSIQVLSDQIPAALTDGWLLAVPFTLTHHPYGQTSGRFVEMGAGMREFVFVGQGVGGGYRGTGGLAGDTTAVAYSGQTEIFGGATENLRTAVAYSNAAGASIPLGEDKTEVTLLVNEETGSFGVTRYSAPFYRSQLPYGATPDKIIGTLPPGVTYSPTGSYLRGTPTAAGTYDFSILGTPYRIVVEKAPLHFYTDGAISYYGQEEYRGDGAPYTVYYYPEDICSIERTRADANSGDDIVVDGVMANLPKLLADAKYTAPRMAAKTAGGEIASQSTPAGIYPVTYTRQPTSLNYEFIYTTKTPAPNEREVGKLAITRRPFVVTKLADGTNVGTIYNDEKGVLSNQTATLGGGKSQFVVQLPPMNQKPDHYEGFPLSGAAVLPSDVLSISYTANYIQTEEDKAHEGFFWLTEFREQRNVSVSKLKLTTTGSEANYRLVGDAPAAPVADGVQGDVIRRSITAIEIQKVPPMEYTYGAHMEDSTSLWLLIKKGADMQQGTYSYTPELAAKLGLRVTWATETQRKAGQPGELDFVPGQLLTVADHNGRYICVSAASEDDQGQPNIVTAYSDAALTVLRRNLTLTASPVERYYGEENGALTFTYKPTQLAFDDRQGRVLTGKGEELLTVLAGQNYSPPTLTAVKNTTDLTKVDAKTPYTGANNAILIEGAQTDNYLIHYTTSGGTPSTDRGDSVLTIRRRLVVIDRLVGDKAADLVTLYADTKRVYTEKLTMKLSDAEISLPAHTAGSATYYPKGGTVTNQPITTAPGFAPDSTPVLAGDNLSLTYTATVVPDNSYHTNFANGYFDMSDADGNGKKTYPVQVSELALAGASANNYTLVYKQGGAAMHGLPNETITYESRPDPGGGVKNYYVPKLDKIEETDQYNVGKGTILLRPIEAIEILSVPKLVYTYGEIFSPNTRNPSTNQRLRVALNYATEHENYQEGNTISETVEYTFVEYDQETGKATSTFDQRSLVIYGLPNQDKLTAGAERVLNYGDYLTVTAHNGVHLMVEGRRGAGDPLIQSNVTQDVITVTPRPLNFTILDQHRYYGEPNGPVSFTFDETKLAKPDQDALALLGQTGRAGTAALTALAAERGYVYTLPTFGTTAQQNSNVINGGRGSYPISRITDGSMDNYTFTATEGKLFIYRRPVLVDQYISSWPDNPIYTIFSDVDARVFSTNVTNSGVTMKLPVPIGSSYPNDLDGKTLPLSGSALYQNDPISLKVTVNYHKLEQGIDMGEASKREHNVLVTAPSLMNSTQAYGNYILTNTGGQKEAFGSVDLRDIESIELVSPPSNMNYTYGNVLSLDGLTVRIRYVLKEGETGNKTATVLYLGQDQFAQYGLHVNYWKDASAPTDSAQWPGVVNDGRIADSGDHVTIAPTHDTQVTSSPFATNGQHLIVSARRHADHKYVQPIMVKADGGAELPIVVSPLALKFGLTAQDKTFDRDSKTAGELTLTNVFNRPGYVDDHHPSGVTDVVFPVTYSAYENGWDRLATGYAGFQQYLADRGGYRFSTGTYVPNETGPLGENGRVDYTEGYTHGKGLTFTLTDPNVAYAEEPTHDSYGALTTIPVEATGIVLGGPDAANYTIVPEITQENADTALGYTAALPRATIHKANREKMPAAIMPQLELDIQTNTVRLIFPQSVDVAQPEEAAYTDETHFEYALQYGSRAGETTAIYQWAGADGKLAYEDGVYFGGEAMTPALPAGYYPDPEDIPTELEEDTIFKGQRYRWAGEDPGFFVADDAYPGGAPYLAYELYRTNRAALPRDAVIWALTRVSETHNFNASPILSSVEGLTPELIQAEADARALVTAARRALEQAETPQETAAAQTALAQAQADYEPAAQAVLTAVTEQSEKARAAAQKDVDYLNHMAEEDAWPEEGESWKNDRPMAPAVKTYAQRLDLVSVDRKQGVAGPDGVEPKDDFDVPTLEAIWFTDVLTYGEQVYMDVVARNNEPKRYYRYAWDAKKSAQLEFEAEDGSPLNLSGPIENIEVDQEDENGDTTTGLITVNQGNIALIYVDTSSGGDIFVENRITIEPRDMTVMLGAEPVQLRVVFNPKWSTERNIRWTSSDSKVVKVSNKGLLTFVGAGTAVISAKSYHGRTDRVTITVLESWYEKFPDSIFDLSHPDAFLRLKEDLFYPDELLTRGQMVSLLARFYRPNSSWTQFGSGEFPDLDGDEPYAQAARLMGRLGVVTGTENGDFDGERLVTRAELVALLARMLAVDTTHNPDGVQSFTDAGEGDTWAHAYIEAVYAMGIVQGVGDGRFAPARPITRAETAAILVRLLADGVDPQARAVLVPKDVPEDHWGYAAILRAINGAEPVPDRDPGADLEF